MAGPLSAQGRPQTRDGFWIGFGAGWGSLGCEDCDDRASSGTGYLRLGGTVSSKVLIGGEVTGWAKNDSQGDISRTLSFGTITGVIVFYPSATGGFFLKGGLGFASTELDLGPFSVQQEGGAIILGLGYDARVGRNVSLTPFFNIVGASIDAVNVNLAQVGLGVTWH